MAWRSVRRSMGAISIRPFPVGLGWFLKLAVWPTNYPWSSGSSSAPPSVKLSKAPKTFTSTPSPAPPTAYLPYSYFHHLPPATSSFSSKTNDLYLYIHPIPLPPLRTPFYIGIPISNPNELYRYTRCLRPPTLSPSSESQQSLSLPLLPLPKAPLNRRRRT